MPDGVRLSATLHFPASRGRTEKFPAVLEYLPCRKDEIKEFSSVHDYFARHGLVSVQVDIRGKFLNARVVKPPFVRFGRSLLT